ncbi:MAG: hypothetical protein KBC36_04940 [Spirochaetia bacterium]|nr:hypothetical protein [Spirochaetia bacterium]
MAAEGEIAPLPRGAVLLRSIDEFWGELWEGEGASSVEIRVVEGANAIGELDEIHRYDGTGALLESRYFEAGEAELVRTNRFDSSPCTAVRVSLHPRNGSWTRWRIREVHGEGRAAIVAEIDSDRRDSSATAEVYFLDAAGRIEECRYRSASGWGDDRWIVARDERGRIVERRSVSGDASPLAWSVELDGHGLPRRETMVGRTGGPEEERRWARVYDERGSWTRERLEVYELGTSGTVPVWTRVRVKKSMIIRG